MHQTPWLVAAAAAAACSSSGSERTAPDPRGATGVELCYVLGELPPGVSAEAAGDQALRAVRERVDALDLERPSVWLRDGGIRVEFLTRRPIDVDAVAGAIGRQRLLRFRLAAHDLPALRALWQRARSDPQAAALGVAAEAESLGTPSGGAGDLYLAAPTRDALAAYLDRAGRDDPATAIPPAYEWALEEEPARPPGGSPGDPGRPARWRSHLVSRSSVLTGQQVEEARVGSDPHTGDPIVELAFDPVGARLLERMSSERIGSRLVTTLDDRVVTAAVIRDRIAGGRAVIAMGTADRAAALAAAHDLALAIQAGALPAPLRLVSSRTFALP